jgi:3-deoxy-D-manno-octulosonic-acid transferase
MASPPPDAAGGLKAPEPARGAAIDGATGATMDAGGAGGAGRRRLPAPLLALYDGMVLTFLGAAAPWFWWRTRRDRELRASLAGRLGRGERRPGERRCLWLHAVSVGEVRLSRPLVEALATRHPGLEVAVSATTTAGLALARRLHPQRFVFQFPLDVRFAVERVFERVRPAALLLVELELWPNLLAAARRRDLPIAVVNARVSERSFRRYRFLERILPQFAQVDRFCAQGEEVAERLRAIGVARERITITGNLKHDSLATAVDPQRLAKLRAECGLSEEARVVVGGSTHKGASGAPGEEELLVALLPKLEAAGHSVRLLLVPRHVERADEVARSVVRLGRRAARLTELRRSGEPPPGDAVVVVDTVGELETVYALGEVVFVGGTLVPRGGQNMLEPAALGRPTLYGPGTMNFRPEVARLREARGAIEVANEEELGRELLRLLADRKAARELGERGRAAVAGLKGGTERTVADLNSLLERG